MFGLLQRDHRACMARRLSAVPLMLAAPAFVHAQTAISAPVEVVRIDTRDETLIRDLAVRHGHLIVDRRKGAVVFEADAAERMRLSASGIVWQVDKEATRGLRAIEAFHADQTRSIPGFACYRTVAETKARLDQLAIQYPGFASVIDIGDSWEKVSAQASGGEDLRVLKLTNAAIAGDKPRMFVMSSIHAREYTPAELMLRFAEWLLANKDTDAEAAWLLDHQEFHFLVHANPDGRKQAETGLSWRKNTNTAYCGPASNSRGADLNRNWPFKWAAVPNNGGSSSSACADTYRGPIAASEPETQHTVNYVRALYPDRRGPGDADPADADTAGLFFDLHSYSQLVLWPWGWTNGSAPNGSELEALGRRFAYWNDYAPQQSVALYPTDGTTIDTAYGELGVASMTFELGTAFFQDCALFENAIFPDNLAALRLAARAARAPYQLAHGPEASAVTVTPDLVYPGESPLISARFDDTRFSNANGGTQSAQAITSATAWIGAPPWSAGASAQAMSASDGGFDEPSELASAQADLSGLGLGRHLAWVQGLDGDGHPGPWTAGFVTVVDPASVAVISGRVSNARTSVAVAGADIRSGALVSASAGDGHFERRLPPGAHSLQVSAAGFQTETLPTLELSAGQSIAQDISLFELCERVQIDVDTQLGDWTPQAPWAATAAATVQTGSRAFTDSPAGSYGNNLSVSLTSPVLNLAGDDQVTLNFDSWCDTEAGWDFGNVEVSINGGTSWSTPVWRCDGDAALRQVSLALPSLANAGNARIRFRFTSDTNTVDDGWYVDNIRLTVGGSACRAEQSAVFANGFEN